MRTISNPFQNQIRNIFERIKNFRTKTDLQTTIRYTFQNHAIQISTQNPTLRSIKDNKIIFKTSQTPQSFSSLFTPHRNDWSPPHHNAMRPKPKPNPQERGIQLECRVGRFCTWSIIRAKPSRGGHSSILAFVKMADAHSARPKASENSPPKLST